MKLAARKAVPLQDRFRVFFRQPGGDVAEVGLIWDTRRRWDRRPESDDPTWQVVGVGHYVIAVRLTL
jgi:hypothetical protein